MKMDKFDILIPGTDDSTAILFNSVDRTCREICYDNIDGYMHKADLNTGVDRWYDDSNNCTDEDKLKSLYNMFYKEQNNLNQLNIVLPLTSECNLECRYCYQSIHGNFRGETRKPLPPWNDDDLNRVYSFIRQKVAKNDFKEVRIRWYGGEPLIKADLIENFGCRLKEMAQQMDRKFSGMIVTNGMLLDDRTVSILKSVNVDRLEISVDGPPDVHNVLRPKKNGCESYNNIMNSVLKAARHFDMVVFRVNIHSLNAFRINEWLNEIKSIITSPNIYLKFNMVEGDDENNLSWEDFCQLFLSYALRARTLGLNMLSNRLRTELCPAIRSNYYVIQSDMKVYKCPQNLGSEEHVAIIEADGTLDTNINLIHWESYSVENDPGCRECAHLPHCNGGCPYNRIMEKINPQALEIYRREEVCCREKSVPELLLVRTV